VGIFINKTVTTSTTVRYQFHVTYCTPGQLESRLAKQKGKFSITCLSPDSCCSHWVYAARTCSIPGCDFLKTKKTCKTNQITEYECL